MILTLHTLQPSYLILLNSFQSTPPSLKYLGNENEPLGPQNPQLLTLNKHALRSTRIISSSNLNICHIGMYLKHTSTQN